MLNASFLEQVVRFKRCETDVNFLYFSCLNAAWRAIQLRLRRVVRPFPRAVQLRLRVTWECRRHELRRTVHKLHSVGFIEHTELNSNIFEYP